jgi:signal recognition particle subunit SRP54
MQKCQKCSNLATLHITEVLGENQFKELHLCEQCANASETRKGAKGDFTLDDFRKHFEMMAEMGGMGDLLSQISAIGPINPQGQELERHIKRLQGMIDSMTKTERRDPNMIDISRRRRIAAGSGTEPDDVKRFVAQFDQVRTFVQRMARP